LFTRQGKPLAKNLSFRFIPAFPPPFLPRPQLMPGGRISDRLMAWAPGGGGFFNYRVQIFGIFDS